MSIRILSNDNTQEIKTVPMNQLKPLQAGIIVDGGRYNNHVVIRTASKETFEVMDLTRSTADRCWNDIRVDTPIKLLDTPIIIKIDST